MVILFYRYIGQVGVITQLVDTLDGSTTAYVTFNHGRTNYPIDTRYLRLDHAQRSMYGT